MKFLDALHAFARSNERTERLKMLVYWIGMEDSAVFWARRYDGNQSLYVATCCLDACVQTLALEATYRADMFGEV